jgi:predicted glycoside hydrolase/deacetylase ChbG (UPF0249 family)
MATKRCLIVNADDFGLSFGVNRGIATAHERGIVTSASLMVRGPAAQSAAAYARSRPELSVGLHVDLAEWVYRDEAWSLRYQVVALSDSTAVADEAARQLSTFYRLMGKAPTHLDSHQHLHRSEPLRSILVRLADALEIPLREHNPDIRYCGQFYGQSGKGCPLPEFISADHLIGLIAALEPGVTELSCHPSEAEDLDSDYFRERPLELRALCDPRVRAALADHAIEIRSFAELRDC